MAVRHFWCCLTAGALALIGLLPQAEAAVCAGASPVDATISRRSGFLQVVLYLHTEPKESPGVALRKILAQKIPQARIVNRLSRGDRAPDVVRVVSEYTDRPADTLPPPSLRTLQYFGRGLSRDEAIAMSGARFAHFIAMAIPSEDFWRQFRAAHEVVYAVASEIHGLIWDMEAREAFNPASWKERLIDSWRGDVPVLDRHYAIHLYRNSDYLRAITVGMAKFGLPDLVVQELAQSENRAVGSLINVLAKRLAERPATVRAGRFDLDLTDIKDARFRDSIRADFAHGATGQAPLCLYRAAPEEGDPDNELLEIAFDRAVGPDRHAKRFTILSRAFGASEEVIRTTRAGDPALLQASVNARALLPSLKKSFRNGYSPGERLLLKYPFSMAVGTGTEYMWVEVSRWDADGSITGLLMNEPQHVPDLHAGQEVKIEEKKVYDYLHVYPDGRREGNESGRILEGR